jgi:KDO2-lipid IV(A) lauroyltransferase
MARERRASLANLRRVSSERGLRLWRRSFALFYNFSRFMVSRLDLPRLSTPQLLGRVVNLEEARGALRAALDDGSGAVVATAHLGNWEMGVRLLRLSDRPVHVVMMADGDGGIEREYERLRAMEGVHVHWLQDSPLLSVELLAALRRGELVALQADRDTGAARLELPFFGAPAWLPLGPACLARAAAVPILPCFVLMESGQRLRVRVAPPIRVERSQDAAADLRAATQAVARAIESAVSEHPDQWFNFYPVWPQDCSPSRAAKS